MTKEGIMTDTPHQPTIHPGNQQAARRRFNRALSDLGLDSLIPPTAFQADGSKFTLDSLSLRQVTLLTNALEDAAAHRVRTAHYSVTPQSPAQPERLPVAFTAARISPLLVQS
jgi:hypothetical protein